MINSTPGIKIFASAGEVSGDRILAQILLELKRQIPDISLHGLGGNKCSKAGLPSLFPIRLLAVNGIGDVLRRLPFFITVYRRMVTTIKQIQPHLVILTDYPGINKRILKFCRRRGFQVYYVCPPQASLYKINKIRMFHKVHVQVLFDREEKEYQAAGAIVSKGHFYQIHTGKRCEEDLLCICPGSRMPVIKRNLPSIMKLLRASRLHILRKFKLIIFVPEELIQETNRLGSSIPDYPIHEISSDTAHVFSRIKYAISFPGTITMELALHNIPTLVFGIIDIATYISGKLLLNTSRTSLPNILSGQEIFPELVSWKWGISGEKFDLKFQALMEQPFPEHELSEMLGPPTGRETARNNCLRLLHNTMVGAK